MEIFVKTGFLSASLDKAMEKLDDETKKVSSMLLKMMSYIYQTPIQKKLFIDLAEEVDLTEVFRSAL